MPTAFGAMNAEDHRPVAWQHGEGPGSRRTAGYRQRQHDQRDRRSKAHGDATSKMHLCDGAGQSVSVMSREQLPQGREAAGTSSKDVVSGEDRSAVRGAEVGDDAAFHQGREVASRGMADGDVAPRRSDLGRAQQQPERRQPRAGRLDRVLGRARSIFPGWPMPASATSSMLACAAASPMIGASRSASRDPGRRLVARAHLEGPSAHPALDRRLEGVLALAPDVEECGRPRTAVQVLVRAADRQIDAVTRPARVGTTPAACDRSHRTRVPASCAAR